MRRLAARLQFHTWPIQRKLTAIAMATAGVALLLITAGFVILTIVSVRHTLVSQLATLADVLGRNSRAALTFNDPRSAQDTLTALQKEPHILAAAVLDKDGHPFAHYEAPIADARPLPQTDTFTADEFYHFTEGTLDLLKPIILEEETIGWIQLRSDLEALHRQIWITLALASLFLALTGLVAYALSAQLQRAISEPILALADSMRHITAHKDYRVRLTPPPTKDELRQLTDGFNEMLGAIQDRDEQLSQHGRRLEAAVDDRTRALAKALAALQENEQFLNSVIEALPIMVFAKDAATLAFVRWNRAAEELTGFTAQEILGKTDYDFFPAPEADAFTEKDRTVLANGVVSDISEEPISTKHRGPRTLHTTKVPILDEQGRPKFLLGISEDITDRLHAIALQREQLAISTLAADINSALAETDTLPGMLQRCTDAIIRHLEAAFARIWLLNPGDLCHECHKAAACTNRSHCLHLAASAGLSENLNGEYRRVPLGALKIGKIAQGWGTLTTNDVLADDRLPNKTWLTANRLQAFAGYPLTVGSQVVGVLAVFSRHQLSDQVLKALKRMSQVISIGVERKRAEISLRTSEKRLALTVQGATIGIWDWDLTTNVVYFSPEWKAQLGYTDAEISHSFHEWEVRVHPDDVAAAKQTVNDYLMGRIAHYAYEHRLRHKNGTYRWILTRGTLFEDPDTGEKRLIGIHIDLTDQKEAHEAPRTAKDAAEAANVAKSRFLATMSHEIRTPMNGVIGMADLLLSTPLTDKQRHQTENIRQSGQALLAILNDILDFSKIEAGKLELEQVAFDLRATVEQAVDVFATQAQGKGLALTCRMANDLPPRVLGDPVRLRQILLNLISNAVKFTAAGSVTVQGTVETRTEDTLRLKFAIIDTGPGIPEEVQGRLFSAFSQADSSTTRRFGGTGLGLAIVKQLVRLMGGDVGITSTPGEGATFWFTIPLGRTESISSKVEPADFLRGRRILIIDDTATTRLLLEAYAASWGADTISIERGAGALAQLDTATSAHVPIDVVLLNLQIADSDPLALAAAIKKTPAYAALNIIAIGGLVHPQLNAASDASPFSAWLAQPLRAQELEHCLRQLRPATPPQTSLPPARPTPMTSGPAHILVVEDNPVNCEIVEGMLELLGYQAAIAHDGHEAIAMSAATPFKAILMDCQMPGMDGFEATAQIRAREQHTQAHRIPIIALTANAMAEDRDRCLAAGMDDYLSKPFSQQDLAALLARWCLQPRNIAAAPAPITAPASSDPTPVPAPALDAPSLNRSAWTTLRQLQRPGRPHPLYQAIRLYLESSPTQIHTLQQAILTHDIQTLAATAHTLKSSSAILGADRLAEFAKQLEEAARTGHTNPIAGLVTAIQTEHQEICRLFQKELAADPEDPA